jgi:dipeptidyl aminopeptidase/acylaminoacyl peptidase
MIPVDGSATRTFSDNKWHVIGALNRSRNAFGIVMQTAVVPPEIYVTRTDSFRPVKISRVNDYLLNYAVPRTEVVRWKSSDGLEIEGLLTYPLSYTPGKRYPLITYVHGGPAGAFLQQYIGGHDITYPVAALAVRGYAILRPNPRGSTGYGPEFTKANLKDFGGKDFQDIMTGIDRVISLGVADSDRLGIMGWSYGGYMTAWAIGHSTRFKAACVGAGPVDFIGQGACDTPETMFHYFGPPYWEDYQSYVTHSALYYVKDINTPTLILHGTEDDRVPYRQGVALYNALKGRNVAVQLVAYPRSGHSVSEPKLAKDVMERNLEWFGKYLPA